MNVAISPAHRHRILAGAKRDANGVRICPRGCSGVEGAPGTHVGCMAAKRKTVGPGLTEYTPPLPGMCAMFYDTDTKEPT